MKTNDTRKVNLANIAVPTLSQKRRTGWGIRRARELECPQGPLRGNPIGLRTSWMRRLLVHDAANNTPHHFPSGREHRDVGIRSDAQPPLTLCDAEHIRWIERCHANRVLQTDLGELHRVAHCVVKRQNTPCQSAVEL